MYYEVFKYFVLKFNIQYPMKVLIPIRLDCIQLSEETDEDSQVAINIYISIENHVRFQTIKKELQIYI